MDRNANNNAFFPMAGTIVVLTAVALFVLTSCQKQPAPENMSHSYDDPQSETEPVDPNWPRPRSDEQIEPRKTMVRIIDRLYGLNDTNVLQAVQNVPRHWFVPESQQRYAYADSPLPIGHNQTISQPFIVAYMTHVLELGPNKNVLELGTGSGYQAAVLNDLTPHVYTIELLAPLAERAQKAFAAHGYTQITAKTGDGYKGWPEHQPFDAIIVTCAPDNIPQPLLDQLKPNGKMIIPVGSAYSTQQLILITKDPNGKITKKDMMPVRFVPMLREKQE